MIVRGKRTYSMYVWFLFCTYPFYIVHVILLEEHHPRPLVFDCAPLSNFDVLALLGDQSNHVRFFFFETNVFLLLYITFPKLLKGQKGFCIFLSMRPFSHKFMLVTHH